MSVIGETSTSSPGEISAAISAAWIDAVPLLVGEAQVDATPPQPIAWTRNYGANHARIFYTSLGAPDDMKIADVRRLLVNGVTWTVAE